MTARRPLITTVLVALTCLAACQSGSDSTTTLTLELAEADPAIQAQTVEVIRDRLEYLGLRGLQVGPEGDDRIVVSFLSDGNAKPVGEMICRTATVEMLLVRPPEDWPAVVEKVDKVCRVTDPGGPTFGELITPGPIQEYGMFVSAADLARVRALVDDVHVQRVVGDGMLRLGRTPTTDSAGGPVHSLYLLEDRRLLAGQDIAKARATGDPNRPGAWQIEIELTSLGARKFARATADNIGRNLAICLDGEVVNAPRINSAIPGGKALIQGQFTAEEASDLAFLLQAGGLPTAVEVVDVVVD